MRNVRFWITLFNLFQCPNIKNRPEYVPLTVPHTCLVPLKHQARIRGKFVVRAIKEVIKESYFFNIRSFHFCFGFSHSIFCSHQPFPCFSVLESLLYHPSCTSLWSLLISSFWSLMLLQTAATNIPTPSVVRP